MSHVKICYRKATLEMPDWLAKRWPYDLDIDKWPGFCGASSGVSEWLIPDHAYGAHYEPACFIHDIDFIASEDSYSGFQSANNRFFRNLLALSKAQLTGPQRYLAYLRRGALYWLAVSTVGLRCYNPAHVLASHPEDNKDIARILKRVTDARLRNL